MFERLKFKKKTDPAPSSAHEQHQHQQQQQPASTPSSSSAFESTLSPPPLIPPPSSSSSSSTTSPPVSYNNGNYIHSYASPPTAVSHGGTPHPASSSTSSETNVHRTPSNSSNHNLHLKSSYTSMHNHYNPYNTTTATTVSTNHMMGGTHDNNGGNNYKVPLENNDANVKVPVSDSATTTAPRPASSHTYSNNSNNSNASNASNYTTASSGSNGLNRNISAGRDSSDWRTNNNHAQHTQAPRTIAATKPTVGAFAAATVNSTDESAASAFVSSPITYQPPAFQGFYTQDGAQQPVTAGAGVADNTHQSSADSLHRAKSIVNAGRETLMQQQEYQNRQMEQFRENLDSISLHSNGSQQSTPHLTNTSGLSFSNGTGNQASVNANHPPLASAVAIAASLAGANGSTDGPRLHDDIQTMDHQAPRPRDRTISEGDSDHGSRLDLANNVGLSNASLGGSSLFSPPLRTNTNLVASNLVTHDIRQTSQRSHIEDGPGPVVLIAIGKTGQGKSSLLNKIMGTSELKASASVRAVTKGIAERSGWGRFEDSRRVLVTVADTPGLADTEGDDEKNIPILKEYIRSVGTRLGINAFLLVFKIDSGVDMIITILTAFNDIMKDFPNFWDNVVLVFTGCDYRRNVMHTKQLYHEEIQAQLEQHFIQDLRRPGPGSNRDDDDDSSSESGKPPVSKVAGTVDEEAPTPIIPMVFLSCAEAPCGFSLGERCDCKARTTFLNAGIKRLWYKVREKKRWVLDADEDDDLNGHS
ncbi:hypothetical protein K457DRAFT_141484 [Linnemannia elongata AG-77]|uniref:AIG1-type G domain-containing protein n=1 Tax=Linnemannia elongata AG-77 TaxID=1314771 RepID=A0A197JII2_9FUNG|nr:hypothetical protein K457DRAFT_141484 [Linnemannia elongata AG-77]